MSLMLSSRNWAKSNCDIDPIYFTALGASLTDADWEAFSSVGGGNNSYFRAYTVNAAGERVNLKFSCTSASVTVGAGVTIQLSGVPTLNNVQLADGATFWVEFDIFPDVASGTSMTMISR